MQIIVFRLLPHIFPLSLTGVVKFGSSRILETPITQFENFWLASLVLIMLNAVTSKSLYMAIFNLYFLGL